VTAVTALLTVSAQAQPSQPPFRPEIPRTWADSAIESLQVPLANPRYTPVPISANYYYRLPVRPIQELPYLPPKQATGGLYGMVEEVAKLALPSGWTSTAAIHASLVSGLPAKREKSAGHGAKVAAYRHRNFARRGLFTLPWLQTKFLHIATARFRQPRHYPPQSR